MQNIQQILSHFRIYIFTFQINKTLDNKDSYMYNNCAIKYCAAMAQSVERILGKDEVTGSIPVSSSKNPTRFCEWDFYLFPINLKQSFKYFQNH